MFNTTLIEPLIILNLLILANLKLGLSTNA